MLQKIEKPFNFIIFGASGDLAKLKLFPAIYAMALQKRFADKFAIVGYARTAMSSDDFRKEFRESVEKYADPKTFDAKILNDLLKNVHYVEGQYDDPQDFDHLADELLRIHEGKPVLNLGYFAVPPIVFESITKNLANIRQKLGGQIQLMIEKPFGHDRESAGELFRIITSHFDKRDLFLIDHYLGKAPVQSILPLRYNNRILNLLLTGSEVANIQITAFESTGVDERIGFFDQVGTLKDMVQSHLLQVLALLTMSLPVNRDVKSFRREKGNVISALRYSDEDCGLILGQYEGYQKLSGVAKNSTTPTFVALRCLMDLTEWYKVPIYIRTGKKLSHKHTYIVVEFKKSPFVESEKIDPNRLIIELYPQERIQIRLVNDIGQEYHKTQAVMSGESLACMGDECLPEYGRLILDAFLERYTSFLSIDEILASWHFVDDLSSCLKDKKQMLAMYADGSDGPPEQYDLTKKDGFQWYDADRL